MGARGVTQREKGPRIPKVPWIQGAEMQRGEGEWGGMEGGKELGAKVRAGWGQGRMKTQPVGGFLLFFFLRATS